jgi:prephenate dehydrogenase
MIPWNKVAIVGVGLIGGSIGLALLRRNLAREVVGIGRSEANLQLARQRGALTATAQSIEAAVAGASLIIVCTPVAQIARDVQRVAQHCTADALITDAGSTKLEIVQQIGRSAAASRWPAGVRFVGGHPLAGSEKRGAAHASADLFVDRTVIVTPVEETGAADVATLRDFWSALGARVVEMSPAQHDQVLARTSHLPHVVAAALAGATPVESLPYTAGGWQDTTRIAGGDIELWRQILLSNRANVLGAIDHFSDRLGQLRSALDRAESAQLEKLLGEARQVRNALGS